MQCHASELNADGIAGVAVGVNGISAVCMRRENNIKSKVMNYDLIELAKRCPDLAITVRLADLVEANRGLIEEIKRELAQSLEASKPEIYLTREKVMEMLEVSPTTLWRWEKCGYLIPISIGSKRRYRQSDILKILER